MSVDDYPEDNRPEWIPPCTRDGEPCENLNIKQEYCLIHQYSVNGRYENEDPREGNYDFPCSDYNKSPQNTVDSDGEGDVVIYIETSEHKSTSLDIEIAEILRLFPQLEKEPGVWELTLKRKE